jgi:hypothetical protein
MIEPGVISLGKYKGADASAGLKDSTLSQIGEKKLRISHAILQRKISIKANPLNVIKVRQEASYIKAKL